MKSATGVLGIPRNDVQREECFFERLLSLPFVETPKENINNTFKKQRVVETKRVFCV